MQVHPKIITGSSMNNPLRLFFGSVELYAYSVSAAADSVLYFVTQRFLPGRQARHREIQMRFTEKNKNLADF
jgi:hypothetical protein